MKYILSVIGMIIFGIIAVILFTRFATTNNQTVQVGFETKHTTDFINNKSKVQYTRYGAIVANEERRTLKIYVSENERVIEILKGYNELVEKRQTFPNNPESYNVFMHALDKEGFTRKKSTKVDNPTGVCANGSTFFYKLSELGNEVTNLWNSSCQPLGGDLGNNGARIRSLFTNQIPNYSEFIRGVSFN
ncbi:hypothetical protein KDA00_03140 [Candidatus Saccharibacteria bacterium]|nr:hypothetical protein [Candidatus Saccharibacteria bacterium]